MSDTFGKALDVTAAASQLGVSVSWLNRLRRQGGGPAFLKLGRRVVYQAGDIASWAAAHRRNSPGSG